MVGQNGWVVKIVNLGPKSIRFRMLLKLQALSEVIVISEGAFKTYPIFSWQTNE